MRQFFTIISVGLIAITLASKAEDQRLDKKDAERILHAQAFLSSEEKE